MDYLPYPKTDKAISILWPNTGAWGTRYQLSSLVESCTTNMGLRTVSSSVAETGLFPSVILATRKLI